MAVDPESAVAGQMDSQQQACLLWEQQIEMVFFV